VQQSLDEHFQILVLGVLIQFQAHFLNFGELLLNLVVIGAVGMLVVWRQTSQKLMQDCPDAVEVGAEVVLLVFNDFGSHVIGTTTVAVGVVVLPEAALAQSEITNVEVPTDINEDVLGLNNVMGTLRSR
jgi:hypothetical protein